MDDAKLARVRGRLSSAKEAPPGSGSPEGVAASPPVDGEDPRIGTTLDRRFRVDQCVREGLLGRSYRAHDHERRRPAMVEVLSARLAERPGVVERFLETAQTVSRVRHANVVRIEEFGRTKDRSAYLVTEWIEGPTLDRWSDLQGPLTWVRARPIVARVVGALQAAHRRKLVHGTLSRSSCVVLEAGDTGPQIKVGNFCVGRVLEAAGTGYEVDLEDLADVDAELVATGRASVHTDIRAVGVMLVRLLSRGEVTGEAIERVAREGLPGLPRPVVAVIQRMLANEGEERFADAKELLEVLENPAALSRLGNEPPRAPAQPPGMPSAAPRHYAPPQPGPEPWHPTSTPLWGSSPTDSPPIASPMGAPRGAGPAIRPESMFHRPQSPPVASVPLASPPRPPDIRPAVVPTPAPPRSPPPPPRPVVVPSPAPAGDPASLPTGFGPTSSAEATAVFARRAMVSPLLKDTAPLFGHNLGPQGTKRFKSSALAAMRGEEEAQSTTMLDPTALAALRARKRGGDEPAKQTSVLAKQRTSARGRDEPVKQTAVLAKQRTSGREPVKQTAVLPPVDVAGLRARGVAHEEPVKTTAALDTAGIEGAREAKTERAAPSPQMKAGTDIEPTTFIRPVERMAAPAAPIQPRAEHAPHLAEEETTQVSSRSIAATQAVPQALPQVPSASVSPAQEPALLNSFQGPPAGAAPVAPFPLVPAQGPWAGSAEHPRTKPRPPTKVGVMMVVGALVAAILGALVGLAIGLSSDERSGDASGERGAKSPGD